jgi:hypothetical protein
VPVSRERRVEWAAPAAAVALGLITVAAGLSTVPLDSAIHQSGPGGPVGDLLLTVAVMLPAAGIGSLLAARRPGNPLGWILLAIFLLAVAPVGQYAVLDYRMHHGTLPLGWVAVLVAAAWPGFLLLTAVLVWLFPDGRLPVGRWRRPAMAVLAAGTLLALAASGNGVAAAARHNVRVDATGTLTTDQQGVWNVLHGAVVFAVLASWLAWLVIQVPRYRRSAGERRQQLKWLYSGVVVFVVSVAAASLASGSSDGIGLVVSNLLTPLGYAAFAACIGMAVLKYRLYAIDRIVSRVITYTIITALTAGLFVGLVLLATEVLPVRHTPVAVAAATLVVAALFNPLRRRVQRAVDRRFNRSRYNAEAIVTAFTARTRKTVDLAAVQRDLTDAVFGAFQPAHVSVWLTAEHDAAPGRGAAPPAAPARRKARAS